MAPVTNKLGSNVNIDALSFVELRISDHGQVTLTVVLNMLIVPCVKVRVSKSAGRTFNVATKYAHGWCRPTPTQEKSVPSKLLHLVLKAASVFVADPEPLKP